MGDAVVALRGGAARRYLTVELLLLAACGGLLWIAWPLWLLVAMGGAAGALTLVAVWMTVRNRQRAVWLQALRAAGLSSSALAACLAISRSIPGWGWWIWGLHAAYFLASILVVHARLEARKTLRKGASQLTPEFLVMRREAVFVQAGMATGAVALLAGGLYFYGAALAGSAAFHLVDLYNLSSERAIALPMKSLGKRALAASIVFTLLVIVGAVIQG